MCICRLANVLTVPYMDVTSRWTYMHTCMQDGQCHFVSTQAIQMRVIMDSCFMYTTKTVYNQWIRNITPRSTSKLQSQN